MRFVGRVAYHVIISALRVVPAWRSPRVRVVLLYNDQILLIKSLLSSQVWSLPGGGIDRDESPEDAAVREVSEETTLKISRSHLRYISSYVHPRTGTKMLVFATRVTNDQLQTLRWPYTMEILDRRWWHCSQLPPDVPLHYAQAIKLALDSKI